MSSIHPLASDGNRSAPRRPDAVQPPLGHVQEAVGRPPEARHVGQAAGSRAAKALDALDPARRSRVLEVAKGVPRKWRAGFLAACAGIASPRQAIAANCRACLGYEDLAEGIAGCTSPACPLWAYRPGGKR